MTRPERYQLPFDYIRNRDPSSIYYEIRFAGHGHAEVGTARFVRVVREEVLVRSPFDAAQHLIDHIFTPFDAFDQEELWVLLLNTKNRLSDSFGEAV